ncbi:hypothetical protein ACGF12_30295 [Kitasatospora sp. NPDC048296]|uniref:hypothetical protein n=1 Tax=Kitasatospora sp. NPDC048296 TaxID=3364048 RepID=UPI00370FBC06
MTHTKKCRTPAKARFATTTAAARTAATYVHSLTPYLCECGWYHLTSKAIVPATSLPVTEQVAALGDVEFAVLVVQDVRATVTPVQAGALRDAANVERWIRVLTHLQSLVEAQFEEQAEDRSPEAEAWRRGAASFRSALLQRLEESTAAAAELRMSEAAEAAAHAKAGQSLAELRQRAELDAVRRLVQAYGAQFNALLIEEYQALGLAVSPRLRRRQARDAAVTTMLTPSFW